jgi:hypothetical protein
MGKLFEKILLKWFINIRLNGIPVTNKIIIYKAVALKKQLQLDIDCKFSDGWIRNFKKRYNIVSRKTGSKILNNNDCNIDTITKFIELVNKKIFSGNYFSVINLDELGFEYDPLINFTLDIKGTQRTYVKKSNFSKQRITIILGIDMMNNIKMKPFIIFKGKTERCLKNIPVGDEYILSYQKNSWCDENQFKKFIFVLPKDKKILLIYDNFRAHLTDDVKKFIKEKFPLIETITLPPNTTPILQPLDVGINKPFKEYIKKKYNLWLIDYFDSHNEFPKISKTDYNMLILKWIKESWRIILNNNDIIKNSFSFCGYGNNNIEQ